MNVSEDIEGLFANATKVVETIAPKLNSDKLLYLYARYKQAKEGPCSIPKPGMFDFQGKKKWEAWSKLEGMSRHQAMQEYLSCLDTLQPDWSKHKWRGSAGLGVSVSTLAHTEEQLSDGEKTVFDWCREGNLQQVSQLITASHLDVNGLDDKGLALLHWACDRGHKDVVEMLLSLDAQVNVKDMDGQTPLHYAVSCEHMDIIRILLSRGADVHAVDNDGLSALDVCENCSLESILQSIEVDT